MNSGDSQKFFKSAIVWTVISVIALILLFMAEGPLLGKICGLTLVGFCMAGQWLRYLKSKK